MLVLGLPDAATVGQRLSTFLVNIVTILLVGAAGYLFLRYREEGIMQYAQREKPGAQD